MKTEIGTLLNEELNEKYYLQNTKTSRKNSKNFAQQSGHEFYIGSGMFYNVDDWNPESP